MHSRTETYHLTNGTGRIEVRGNRAASGLFLDGKPFVFDVADCEGSIGQDLYRFARQPGGERLADLSELTTVLPTKATSLTQIIVLLLRQFTSGTYTLTLAPLVETNWVEYWTADPPRIDAWSRSGYYPMGDYFGEKTLIATQPDEIYDESRIAHFWYAIENGARPFLITASVEEGMCEFVLDGHHKMRAYVHAKIPPWRLCISKIAKPLLHSDWPAPIVDSPLSWQRLHEWQRKQAT